MSWACPRSEDTDVVKDRRVGCGGELGERQGTLEEDGYDGTSHQFTEFSPTGIHSFTGMNMYLSLVCHTCPPRSPGV